MRCVNTECGPPVAIRLVGDGRGRSAEERWSISFIELSVRLGA